MAEVARQVPMTPEMSLRPGSITKQFTATAIMMLADEGKLAVSDDITKFLPHQVAGGRGGRGLSFWQAPSIPVNC
jgi:CubicO group peptidase (beta-lactamase class C family)